MSTASAGEMWPAGPDCQVLCSVSACSVLQEPLEKRLL